MFQLLNIDWKAILFGEENLSFLPEVAIRSVAMFLMILFSLRILGKRSITQLSIFELGVIIGLGSAAGDPMFYKDVGILPGILVFVVVIAMYRFVTFLINNSKQIEKVLEGTPVYLVEEGRINHKNFQNESVAHEEFFAQLRQHSVSHLGQVKLAIIETNGAISLYYYPDDEVKFGLPVLPHLCSNKLNEPGGNPNAACTTCGTLAEKTITQGTGYKCSVCGENEWVAAINEKRIN